jgi:hypothetical protein
MLCRAPVIRRDPSLAIPARKPRGVVGDHAPLQRPVLVKTPTTLAQPLAAIARNLLGLRSALSLKRLLSLTQPRAAITAVAKPRRQLITALVSMERVLGSIQGGRLAKDLLGNLLVAARPAIGRRRGDPRAVDDHDTELDHPGLRAELEHPTEQLGDRALMPRAKARDRRMIGRLIGSDHPKGDVLAATSLDRS